MNYNYIHQKLNKRTKLQKKVVKTISKHVKEYKPKKTQQEEEDSAEANIERVINVVNRMNVREQTVRGVDPSFAHEVDYVEITPAHFHADILLSQLRHHDSELAALIDRIHRQERHNDNYIQHFLLPLVQHTYGLNLNYD